MSVFVSVDINFDSLNSGRSQFVKTFFFCLRHASKQNEKTLLSYFKIMDGALKFL